MADFRQQLEKVSRFFQPENLRKQRVKIEGDVALLVIDVQKEYCDPRNPRGNFETDFVSKRIQSAAQEFRALGIPVYVVYSKTAKKKRFHEFVPHRDDILIGKKENSAFKGSRIGEILKRDKRKTLLACGFNLNACVKQTVMDGCAHGFEVRLLRDLSGNDNECNEASGHSSEYHLKDMETFGVKVESSHLALSRLREQKNNPPQP